LKEVYDGTRNARQKSVNERFNMIGRMICEEPPHGDFAQAEIELSRLSMQIGFAHPDIVHHRKLIWFLRDA